MRNMRITTYAPMVGIVLILGLFSRFLHILWEISPLVEKAIPASVEKI